jgi:hypothetical protein
MSLRSLWLGSAAALTLLAPQGAGAQTIGSGNVAVIDPPVAHPDEKPCIVPLSTNAVFGANAVSFTYTPPKDCPGPWATVVLSVDIGLDKGIQYDRSGQLFLAGVPLWFGTTAEPTPDLAPHWHVERDVTDYSALYTSAQTGSFAIVNYTNSTDTSVITASASLAFYPATRAAPAPVTADLVIPLPVGGGLATLNTGTDTLSTTLLLPTNILSAKLDLYLQGQSSDEFWYTCVPTDVAGELQSCGNGALREGEISVDGIPAGVAPIYPWIFTGGIDPYLWAPIPGVQTLDFKPFHADLAPFAGVLSQPKPHTVAVSVFGANQYFSATGALRLFLDPKSPIVTGGIVKNTLAAAPVLKIVEKLKTAKGTISGTVDTADARSFTIVGTTNGSAGPVVNTLTQQSRFTNGQSFLINASTYVQDIKQTTDIYITSTTTGIGAAAIPEIKEFHYPLALKITLAPAGGGNIAQTTKVDQGYLEYPSVVPEIAITKAARIHNEIHSQDTLVLDSNYNLLGNQNQAESATYFDDARSTGCIAKILIAANNVLTGAGTGCP